MKAVFTHVQANASTPRKTAFLAGATIKWPAERSLAVSAAGQDIRAEIFDEEIEANEGAAKEISANFFSRSKADPMRPSMP